MEVGELHSLLVQIVKMASQDVLEEINFDDAVKDAPLTNDIFARMLHDETVSVDEISRELTITRNITNEDVACVINLNAGLCPKSCLLLGALSSAIMNPATLEEHAFEGNLSKLPMDIEGKIGREAGDGTDKHVYLQVPEGELLNRDNPLDLWFYNRIAFWHYFGQFETEPRKMTDRVARCMLGLEQAPHEEDEFKIMSTTSQVEVDDVEIPLIHLA